MNIEKRNYMKFIYSGASWMKREKALLGKKEWVTVLVIRKQRKPFFYGM
jgi:hypothetical protein